MKSSAILALGFILVVSAAALIPTTTFPDEPEPKAYRVAPIRRPPGHEERRRAAAAQAEAIESGRLAPALEEEAALRPTPRRPVMTSGFAGMNFATSGGTSVPPDTIAATGPSHIVEVVNASIAIFNRTTGAAVGSTPQLLGNFFSALGTTANNCIFDPVVAYDELAQRFYVGALDVPAACALNPSTVPQTTNLLYAVSTSSDPTAGFTKYAIDVSEPGIFCPVTVGGDFTRTGWNADAHVFTFNMFGLTIDCYDHVSVIVIDKATIGGTLTVRHNDFNTPHFSLIPATMHVADPGDPMWFVEESPVFFDTIRVVKMTDVLSATPTFTETDIAVDTYGSPPSASQKGGGKIDAGDTRILHVESRGDRLVAAHTVGVSGIARARWYEFDTSGIAPTLTQQGTINRGTGVHTYYPSIAIAPNGDLGMTFMQSSSNEYISMYVTGQMAGDPPGTMQFPVLAKAGEANYRAFDCFNFQTRRFMTNISCRAGDYSGITVDPDTPDTFCAANEYAASSMPGANWGTWITCFSLVPLHDLAVTGLNAPKTASGSPVTLPVTVTIQNRSDHNETIPDIALGDGVSTGLVRLSVNVVDNDNESCLAAVIALDDPANNAALFLSGPKVLAPTESITVNFKVTYNCAVPRNPRKDRTPADYSHTATVHHDALDTHADDHAADDICPRPPLPGKFDSNPPGIGSNDSGCGAKKSKTTFGNPVVTNVVP
jgi:hypothetical protein